MKNKLKSAMKPTPERFSYSVKEAAREAAGQPAYPKKRLSTGWRTAIALAIIAALIPTSVFGASKLYELIAKPVDNYGLELKAEATNGNYPEYVRIKVDVPEGFAVEPNTDDLKYSAANGGGSFSLCPMRPKGSADIEVVSNVDSYEEIALSGHAAYRIKQLDSKGYDRVYVSYSDMNVLLLIYYNDVSEEELADFVSGISFTEGTKDDHTQLWELFDERSEDKVAYSSDYKYIELDRGTVMTFSGCSESQNDESLRYTAKISSIRISNDLSGIDATLINQMYSDEALTDDSGKLLPRTVTVTKAGDGFNTTDEVQSVEEREQKLVLIDLTYANLSDEDAVAYLPYNLETLTKKADGSYDQAKNIDPDNKITSSENCDSELFYVSDPIDTVYSFYRFELKANETKTVTIGSRCCTDMLDKAYLTIIDAGSMGVVDPTPDGYNSAENILNYIIKVQ